MADAIRPTQYRYSTVFTNGVWDIMVEDDFGTPPRLLTQKVSEAEARATVGYMQNIRTQIITTHPMQDKWF